MIYSVYETYSQIYGTAEGGYRIPHASDKQAAALAKSVADKYLRTKPAYSVLLKDNSAPELGCEIRQHGFAYYMMDLELAPVLAGKWVQLPDIPNMYVKYLKNDLFKVCFIAPFFLYEKPASKDEYDWRSHYILHLPEDDQKIIIYNQGVPSSAIGPGQGYNVCYTCVHYFGNGLEQFYLDLVHYKKSFNGKELLSDMDAVYAATAIRAAESLSPNPVNVKPLYFDLAKDLLQETLHNT